MSLQFFSLPILHFLLYILLTAFVYYFVFPVVFSFSHIAKNRKLFSSQMRMIAFVCAIGSYLFLLGTLLTNTQHELTIILSLLLGLFFFGYTYAYEKTNATLFFFLLGIVVLYHHLVGYFPKPPFTLFVFFTLLLPCVFVFATFYTKKPTYASVYMMHYFGFAFMLFMTLQAILGLQAFAGSFHPGILHISILFIFESLIWYLSWMRITEIQNL